MPPSFSRIRTAPKREAIEPGRAHEDGLPARPPRTPARASRLARATAGRPGAPTAPGCAWRGLHDGERCGGDHLLPQQSVYRVAPDHVRHLVRDHERHLVAVASGEVHQGGCHEDESARQRERGRVVAGQRADLEAVDLVADAVREGGRDLLELRLDLRWRGAASLLPHRSRHVAAHPLLGPNGVLFAARDRLRRPTAPCGTACPPGGPAGTECPWSLRGIVVRTRGPVPRGAERPLSSGRSPHRSGDPLLRAPAARRRSA